MPTERVAVVKVLQSELVDKVYRVDKNETS